MRWIGHGIVLAFSFVAVACAAGSTPRSRVARDLGCTAEQTTVVRTGEFRWQVTGCGRTASYVCTYPVRDCWREGHIHHLGNPPPNGPQPLASAP